MKPLYAVLTLVVLCLGIVLFLKFKDRVEEQSSYDNDVIKDQIYTNSDFPDFALPYDSSWDITISENLSDEVNKDIAVIKLTKSGVVLDIHLATFQSMGAEPICDSSENLEFKVLNDGWLRITDTADKSFIYIRGTTKTDCYYETVSTDTIIPEPTVPWPTIYTGTILIEGSYEAESDLDLSDSIVPEIQF